MTLPQVIEALVLNHNEGVSAEEGHRSALVSLLADLSAEPAEAAAV